MEGERQKLKDFLIGFLVVVRHGIEEGFFVAYDVVVN